MHRPDALAVAACAAFAVVAGLLSPATALPPPPGPPAAATASPSPIPNAAAYLPVGSPIDFVLDDPVNSKKTQPGSTVRLHLAKALNVGGVELAPAGTPGTIKVISTRPAVAPDGDGAVEIILDPLMLPGRGPLPVAVTKSFVTVERTAGQQSTGGIMDTVETILLPAAVIYQATRKGHEVVLPVGTLVHARTEASIDASHAPTVVIATPPPFQLNTDVPHAGFTPIPLYTVPTPLPRAKPSPTPTPAITASPVAPGTPAASR
jgi:hypothetical protein